MRKAICAEDYTAANEITENLINHNNYLSHPLGLEAEGNAKKIQDYLRRFTAVTDQDRFTQKGLTSSAISRNTGLTTLEVNNALSLLAFTNWITFHSDKSGNVVARFRPEIFVMDVA